MRRKAMAWTAAILIIAAVSACFLRPVDTPYTFATRPFHIKLVGENADRFEVNILRLCGANLESTGVDVSIRSLDGNYYTLGSAYHTSPWNYIDSYTFGTVEKLGETDWEEYDVVDNWISFWIHGGMGVNHPCSIVVPIEDESPPDAITTHESIAMTLPFYEPGHYRVNLRLREYIPNADTGSITEGKSTSELIDIHFEYTVPERTNEPMDVLGANLRRGTYTHGDEEVTYASLSAVLLTNCGIRYFQPDTLKLERKTLFGYEEVEGGIENSEVYEILRRDYIDTYNKYMNEERFYHAEHPMSLSIIPLQGITLVNWNTHDEYRFSIDFTENPDGTGERYTLTLPLKFSEQ